MRRKVALCVFLLCGYYGPLFAQATAEQQKAAAALYESYKKHVSQKNWILANNIGSAIVRNYPDTNAARAIAPELPEMSKRADAAYKEQQAKAKDQEAKAAKDKAVAQQNAADLQARQKKAVAGLRKERDEVERITFYTSAQTPKGVANQWHLYIGVPDGKQPYLRFEWMYTAETWLFVRSITLSIDGVKAGPGPVSSSSVKRDNSGGKIWEWQDEPVSDKDIPFFKRLAASKKTIIRYEGDKYYKDRDLSSNEKSAMSQVLLAYEALSTKALSKK